MVVKDKLFFTFIAFHLITYQITYCKKWKFHEFVTLYTITENYIYDFNYYFFISFIYFIIFTIAGQSIISMEQIINSVNRLPGRLFPSLTVPVCIRNDEPNRLVGQIGIPTTYRWSERPRIVPRWRTVDGGTYVEDRLHFWPLGTYNFFCDCVLYIVRVCVGDSNGYYQVSYCIYLSCRIYTACRNVIFFFCREERFKKSFIFGDSAPRNWSSTSYFYALIWR